MISYRTATFDDIPEMCRIRNLQLIDEGDCVPVDISAEMEDFFTRKLTDGSLVQWIAEEDGRTVATAAILFIELTPYFGNPEGWIGYITDMYTDPAYRKRGIASGMLGRLRSEAEARNVKSLMLGASAYGRPVYEKFGFSASEDWMDMDLE